ncbi:DUF1822 family protein [Leptothoe sp. EHU-05/26/07-4]
MSIQPSNPDPFKGFHPVATETIMLTNTSTQWAQRVCRDIADADEQWHSFLRALAITGFEQWLNQGNSGLPISYSQTVAPGTDATIQVGDFRLYILPMGTLKDDQVVIPASALSEKHTAHLYVLVEVHEEVAQVRVRTALLSHQLEAYVERQCEAEEYGVPVSEFTVPPEKLLWYLSCLKPEAIIKPDTVTSSVKEKITTQLHETVTTVINTGKWLQGQLDTVAEQLAWQFIPSLECGYELRDFRDAEDPLGKISDILRELQDRSVGVPTDAVGACQSVRVGNVICYFYTFIWELAETNEWSSLFVLFGADANEPLPIGTELQVSDQTSVMSTSKVQPGAMTTFLYIQAIGNLDELFTVDISSSDGETLTLPPFGFV